jgi:hypothetical protein
MVEMDIELVIALTSIQPNTGGTGFRAEVSELIGKDITEITTSLDRYGPCVFVWDTEGQISAYYRDGFELNNDDTVLVSGLSNSVLYLSGNHKIGFSSETVSLGGTMTSYGPIVGGKYEDIFVSSRPDVSIGGKIFVQSSSGREELLVLNDYQNGVLRVKRNNSVGVAHSYGSNLTVIGDRVTIPVKTKEFASKVDDLVYFNTKDSVGVGTTGGGAQSKTFTVGNISETVSVPFRSIYLPNHPFKTGQRLTFTKSNIAGVDSLIVGNDNTALNTFFVPDNLTLSSDVYVINKSKDYIGLTTQVGLTTNTEGLFFYSDGSDNSEYLLKSNYAQVTGDIDRLVTTVSCGQSHGLNVGDTINLKVKPNISVGLGNTLPVELKLEVSDQRLLVNPVGFDSSKINVSTNVITISNHGYSTGDKIYYDSSEVASGLSTGYYYIIKDTANTFRLSETKYESNPLTENEVSITGIGGTHHTVSLVNPKINVVKNSILTFNLEDPSLAGYNLKLFREKEFESEFVSASDSQDFNVIGLGTIGYSGASLSISYSDNVPSKLFYTLEKSGYISTADIDVSNYSQINYIDSEYNGTYEIFGISTSSFKISPKAVPSSLSYQKEDTDVLEYSTKSSTAINGSIGNVKSYPKDLIFHNFQNSLMLQAKMEKMPILLQFPLLLEKSKILE